MKKVLVVDDEELVVNLVEAVLQRGGYQVFSATNGDEALQISEQHAASIDLLITNHCLRSESGREVAARLDSSQPHMKVLQISGYTEMHLSEEHTKVEGGSFLQKPFTPQDLMRAVKEMLND